jgi:hypothetical protein
VPLVLVATSALLLTALALAGPAAAIEDPRRPAARITHGPSCGPGEIRVRVTNGTEAHRVDLVLDGTAEQDAAVLAPDQQTELHSADVDRGVTVDVSVTVTSADGTVAGEPLELGTYTRPSRADCDAVSAPGDSPTGPASSAPGAPSAPSAGSTPGGGAAGSPVTPGGVVTLRGTGFLPGEPVYVSVPGLDESLTTVTAGVDGTAEAIVQIPRGTDLGPLTVQLVGQDSATTTGLDLQVAARETPATSTATPVPVLAVGSALLAAGAGLGLYAARRPRDDAAQARRS